MANLLFVKAGNVDAPVTKELGPKQFDLSAVADGRTLNYLGLELPGLGKSSRLDAFRGPEHVVLSLSEREAVSLGKQHGGLYQVIGLRPASVNLVKAAT